LIEVEPKSAYMKKGTDFFKLYSKSGFTFFVLCAFTYSCDKSYPSLITRNASNNNIQYTAIFTPVHSNDSTRAFGNVSAVFNTFSYTLDYNIHWDSLSSRPVAMLIDDNGSIMTNINVFSRFVTDSVSGTVVLTTAQANDLAAGSIYVMIPTIKYPDGEIMASLNAQ
jgi:CHRD domain